MKNENDEPNEAEDDIPEDEAEPKRENLLAGLVRKAISQGVGAIGDERAREAIVNEVLKRARQTSTLVDKSEDSVRRLVSDLPLPKDVIDRLIARLDDYKADILDVVKEEIHEFLTRIDLGHELQKALTSLSLEVSTEIRFIPNEKGVGRVKADIKNRTRVKRRKRKDEEDAADDEG